MFSSIFRIDLFIDHFHSQATSAPKQEPSGDAGSSSSVPPQKKSLNTATSTASANLRKLVCPTSPNKKARMEYNKLSGRITFVTTSDQRMDSPDQGPGFSFGFHAKTFEYAGEELLDEALVTGMRPLRHGEMVRSNYFVDGRNNEMELPKLFAELGHYNRYFFTNRAGRVHDTATFGHGKLIFYRFEPGEFFYIFIRITFFSRSNIMINFETICRCCFEHHPILTSQSSN